MKNEDSLCGTQIVGIRLTMMIKMLVIESLYMRFSLKLHGLQLLLFDYNALSRFEKKYAFDSKVNAPQVG